MAVISTSDFKTRVGISGSTYDTLIGQLIAEVQDEAERYCGTLFDSAERTETVDGLGTPAVFVKALPITAIASVSIKYGSSTVALASTDYRYTAATGRIERINSGFDRVIRDEWGASLEPCWPQTANFPEGHQNIVVVYTGGYTSQTMPSALKGAMYAEVAGRLGSAPAYTGAGLVSDQYLSERLGDYSYQRRSVEERWQSFSKLFEQIRRFTV